MRNARLMDVAGGPVSGLVSCGVSCGMFGEASESFKGGVLSPRPKHGWPPKATGRKVDHAAQISDPSIQVV